MEMPSMVSFMLWPLIFQIILPSFSSSLPIGNETDRLSLLAFRDQIQADPLGRLSSWNESLHFCEWLGVTCGRRHRRLVELDLSSSQLVGSLSPHIGNLSFLRILNLDNNSFSHSIPQEIGHSFRLQQLLLWNNTFTGEIPVNISWCSNLITLKLAGNKLTGRLPGELGTLSKMKFFSFERNNLAGDIPPFLGNLSSIEEIFGWENNLQGGVPNSFGQLKRLKKLSLGLNNLSGTIPPSIYNLSSLTSLSVPVNQLHGSLRFDLGLTLPNLEILNIHTNQFSGLIPASLSNASKITDLDLSSNNFNGKVPHLEHMPNLQRLVIQENDLGNNEDDDLSFLYPLANKTSLQVLGINENNLGGVLPEIIGNFSLKLRHMAFRRNQIRGSIPTNIGNLVNLQIWGWETNQVSGIIPSSIGKLRNLHILSLFENKISGSIPFSLGNITSLIEVDLSANNLHGSIPSSLGNCRNLLTLVLYQNNLSGSIPKEVRSISSLSKALDLSENQLTGSLPSEMDKLVNLGYLDVSRNRLSGEIPRSLGSCVSLEYLYLGDNSFHGLVPESLSSLRALQDFNISHNNLTGNIPKFLREFKLLTTLDVSLNDLEGEVPVEGVFANASGFSILGNKDLCGGIPQLNLSRCTSNESSEQKSSSKKILSIAIPSIFLGVILMMSSLLFFCWRKRKNMPFLGASWDSSLRRVAYEELFQATGGFSSSNLIGAGSFGSVYKGILASDGAVVAVKVFNLLRKGASESFMAECAALINIRHRNLVKVLTACSSIDFEGQDFKALVYEFMVNGSLEEWLHPVHIEDSAHEPRRLNLIQRLNIAIDVASTLDYLQHQCEIPVVHCDLKPSNVLLDGDMTARVGDFGLARFLQPQISSNQTSSVGLKGTVGYAAPEYGMGSKVSTYGDVYSYGVLLLEMFTGKRPTDSMFKDGLSLHSFAKMALPNYMADVLDPILLREAEETIVNASRTRNNIGSEKILECLVSIIKVGVACSVKLPRERMEIGNVATELFRIRDILLGTRMRRRREHTVTPEGE